MDTAFETLQGVVPRVKVVGKFTVHALDSVPVPVLVLLFVICAALFQWPISSNKPMLPTTSRDQKRLIALPCSHAGRFTYLNTFTRQLVVSEKPLLPPSPPPVRKDKSGKLRAALRGYRPPLRCVPEDIEDAAMLAAIIKEKS